MSVVIPTRDRWALLAVTLTSVIVQEGIDIEIVVVDDGSASPMPSRGSPWEEPRLRTVRHEVPRGVAAARNAGIHVARGSWIAFLDDDDVWAPTKLRVQLAAAEARDATFTYSAAVLVNETSGTLDVRSAPEPDGLLEALRSCNVIPAGASNVMVRAATLKEVGGFDPRFSHLADWDLWIRLTRAGSAASCDEVHVGYRLHPGSMRSSVGGVERELRALDHKHHGGRVTSRDRLWVYRWHAEGQVLARQRIAAARTLVLGGLRCRSPFELYDARALFNARTPGTQAPVNRHAIGWLAPFMPTAANAKGSS